MPEIVIAQMPISLESVQRVIDLTNQMKHVGESQFEGNAEDILSRLQQRSDPVLFIASVDGVDAAYKYGFYDDGTYFPEDEYKLLLPEFTTRTFTSWEGAVLPAFRGHGLATLLMEAQHTFIKQTGRYDRIWTDCWEYSIEMVRLNLRHGFMPVWIERYARADDTHEILHALRIDEDAPEGCHVSYNINFCKRLV